jgi:hypothetical protein
LYAAKIPEKKTIMLAAAAIRKLFQRGNQSIVYLKAGLKPTFSKIFTSNLAG